MGTPPLRLAAVRSLPCEDSRLRKMGSSEISALRHSVLAPMAFLGPAPLHGTPAFPRLVLLRTAAASRGSPRAIRLDVASLRAVAASDIWSDLLGGLDLVPAALQPQSLLANSMEGVLVCKR